MSHVYNSYLFYAIFFRDIAKYNTDDDLEESIEETGWKLVHGDVFRPPQVKFSDLLQPKNGAIKIAK